MAKIVRWNADRGFGFVKLDDGREAFIHFTALDKRPSGQDLTGCEVQVDGGMVLRDQKGLKVMRARVKDMPKWKPRWDIGFHSKHARVVRYLESRFAHAELIAFRTYTKLSMEYPSRLWFVEEGRIFRIYINEVGKGESPERFVREITLDQFMWNLHDAHYLLRPEGVKEVKRCGKFMLPECWRGKTEVVNTLLEQLGLKQLDSG